MYMQHQPFQLLFFSEQAKAIMENDLHSIQISQTEANKTRHRQGHPLHATNYVIKQWFPLFYNITNGGFLHPTLCLFNSQINYAVKSAKFLLGG